MSVQVPLSSSSILMPRDFPGNQGTGPGTPCGDAGRAAAVAVAALAAATATGDPDPDGARAVPAALASTARGAALPVWPAAGRAVPVPVASPAGAAVEIAPAVT